MGIYIVDKIRDNKLRAFQTFAFMLSFVGVGLCESALGPSLLDFQLAVNVSLSDIAWVMPACMVGFVIGSFLTGFVMYPYINPFLCDAFCLFFSSMTTTLLPYNTTLVGLLLTVTVNGITLGIIDAIGNLTVLLIWGKECVAFMQLLHLGFGLGAVFGPFIAGSFLLPLEVDDRFLNTSKVHAIKDYTAENLKFQTAYLIFAIYLVCIAMLFLYIFLRHYHALEHPSRKISNGTKSYLNVPRQNQTTFKILICLSTAFMHIYYGLEIAISTFLTTFGVYSDLHLSKETGAWITSVCWSTASIFQLTTVFFINKIGPEKMIIFELTVIMLANCVLLPFGNTYVWSLWVGAAIIGLGISAIWAAMFAYFENYFPVTNKIACTFTISACIGELIVPNIVGAFIEKVPMVFLWVVLSHSVAICILFIVINTLCKSCLIVESFSSNACHL